MNELPGSTPLQPSPELEAIINAPGRREVRRLPNSALVDRDFEQDITLKNLYARGMIAFLGLQMTAADLVFVFYAWRGEHWKVPGSVMQGWLAATVVELVGIVLVVTRYLVPRRDSTSEMSN